MPDPSSRSPLLRTVRVLTCAALSGTLCAQAPKLDESPRRPGEWGDRPAQGAVATVNPPPFVCRLQKGATTYIWQIARSRAFTIGVRHATSIYPVHCPEGKFSSGTWYWRYRCETATGTTAWSKTRTFTIPEGLSIFAMPDRATLLGRLPKQHPRLFLRPEQVPGLRKSVTAGAAKEKFEKLLARCARYHGKRPATAEPKKYPQGTVRRSEAWRRIWWGNRTKTIAALAAAADLGFAGLIGGEDCARHTRLGKELLLACAKWNPRGATGYRYNDEAGMPYAYWFSRAYTYLHAALSEKERQACQAVMAVRGAEMYAHLAPAHFFRPYGSHQNRAWHFLGEVGIAFHGEIEAADEWVWFASRVFGAVYPVWGDADGGWHEGMAYWRSYLDRFTWWADVQKAAFGVDAYQKPFFSKVGDFPLYVQPPGTRGGGFGDLASRLDGVPMQIGAVLSKFANAADNGAWAWRARQEFWSADDSCIGFLRSQRKFAEVRAPVDQPTSKLFRGVGLAALNTTLLAAEDNVQVLFKSSPFGTQSHGYDAQNSFLLYAFGERLLIRSGHRDVYGSKHHTQWMWSTRSDNCITVDGGRGQGRRSARAVGRITAFHTSPAFDYVVGEAGAAYQDLSRFTRRILFVKPDYVVVHDTLLSDKPRTFDYWLHALRPFTGDGNKLTVRGEKASCHIQFLTPTDFAIERTTKCDPPPRPRIQLNQHHLSASTKEAAQAMTFVTVIRPFKTGEKVVLDARLSRRNDGGYTVRVDDVVIELTDTRTRAARAGATFDSAAPKPDVDTAAKKKGA